MHELTSLQHDLSPPGSRFDPISQQSTEECADVSWVGADREWTTGREDQPALAGPGFVLESAHDLRSHQLEVESHGSGDWRACEQHQVADHIADAKRLGSNCHQCLHPIGISLAREQLLNVARNRRDRIVDFMTGPGGELGEGAQFFIGRRGLWRMHRS
jgi:hypothetical protein